MSVVFPLGSFSNSVFSGGSFASADDAGGSVSYLFAGATTLPSGITFSRASAATYYDSAGLVKVASSGTARFTYNPTTLVARGLMREPAGTNILNFSETASNAYWTKSSLNAFGATDTGAAGAGSFHGTSRTLDPAGGNSADFCQVTSSGAGSVIHAIRKDATIPVNAPMTQSVYVKPAGYNFCVLRILDASATGNGALANFNLSTGAVDTSQKIGNGVLHGATIKTLPNGWFRISLSCTPNTAANATVRMEFILKDVTGTGVNVTGDNTSGLYFYGFDLKADRNRTSYVPATGAASATRAAETITLAGRAYKGAIADFELDYLPTSGVANVVQLDSGADTANTRVAISVNTSSVIKLSGDTTSAGTDAFVLGSSSTVETSWDDVFLYEKVGSNPTAEVADTTADTFTTVRIGTAASGSEASMTIGRLVLNIIPSLSTSLTELTGAPVPFDWFFNNYKIYIKGDGSATTNFNFDAFKPSAGTTYYVSPSGNNANAGTSMVSPLLTIDGAIAKGDCGAIVLQATQHARNVLPAATLTGSDSIAVSVEGGGRATIIGGNQNVSWTASLTYPGLYETVNTTSVQGCVDLAVLDGNNEAATGVVSASGAAVLLLPAGTPGIYSDGAKWYAKTANGRNPNLDNTFFGIVQQSFILQPSASTPKWTFENIDFQGVFTLSFRAASTTSYPTIGMRSCTVKYCPVTSQGNGLQFLGSVSYLLSTEVSKNAQDGANYKENGGRMYQGFELGCTGYRNGDPATATNDNISTAHRGGPDAASNYGSIIRANGTGGFSYGPTYADVKDSFTNPNILAINVRGMGSNKAVGKTNFNIDCYKRMINCTSEGTVDWDVQTNTGCDFKYFGSQTFSYSGSVVPVKVTSLSSIW